VWRRCRSAKRSTSTGKLGFWELQGVRETIAVVPSQARANVASRTDISVQEFGLHMYDQVAQIDRQMPSSKPPSINVDQLAAASVLLSRTRLAGVRVGVMGERESR
jgi:hypothetical protein